MGGCVVSCMSAMNSSKQIENEYAKKLKGRKFGVETTPPGPTETGVWRSPSMADLSTTEMYDQFYVGKFRTVSRQVKDAVERLATRNAMAYRPWDHIEKTEIEEGGKKKPWELIHLKETQYITYKDMWERMMAFGNGLAKLGLQPGSFVGIYEETRWEWMITVHGLWAQGLAGVTVYSNLGEDALRYAIKESELPAMILNAKNVKSLIKNCKATGVRIPKLIYLDTLPADLDTEGAELISWTSVLESGRGMPEPELPSDPNALALIMYTSGTTGDPKGVVLTHGNLNAAIGAVLTRLQCILGETCAPGDNFICYLPLAHIYECTCEQNFLIRGCTLCYGHPRTLTDLAARPHGDFTEFKPIFVTGVPRVYDTIKKAVMAKLPPAGTLKRRVFDRAFEERRLAMQKGLETPYWNEKVFSATRNMLGGRCRCMGTGGAPCSIETYEFTGVVFGCHVMQGYGMTETCCGCLQLFYEINPQGVGGPFPGCELKLRDVEEWKHTDNPPRGEICCRGPGITKGYFKQPDKTTEAYGSDGWFYTGDIGQIEADGSFTIIGRTKALAKNLSGEYVALEALEAVYVQNDLVMPNGVCVLVNTAKAYIAAIVLTDEKKAMKWANENKIEGTWPDILLKPEFHQKAAVSLAETAKKAGKKPFETVKYVRVLKDEWTPENGVITAAMKLKRRVIDQRYAPLIKELFSE